MKRKKIESILHNCSKTIDESVNMVGASDEIVKYIYDLEQQIKKQKKVINNIKRCFDDGHFEDGCDCLIIEKYIDSYLKEVE